MNIRPVTDADCAWFWRLAMEPSVRENSVRSEYFDYDQHREWWALRTSEPTTRIYIGEVNGQPIGHVRFGLVDGTHDAEIAISVEPESRVRGYATEMLRLGEPVAQASLGVERFVALVLHKNIASHRLFERSGYLVAGVEARMERLCYRFVKDV